MLHVLLRSPIFDKVSACGKPLGNATGNPAPTVYERKYEHCEYHAPSTRSGSWLRSGLGRSDFEDEMTQSIVSAGHVKLDCTNASKCVGTLDTSALDAL